MFHCRDSHIDRSNRFGVEFAHTSMFIPDLKETANETCERFIQKEYTRDL